MPQKDLSPMESRDIVVTLFLWLDPFQGTTLSICLLDHGFNCSTQVLLQSFPGFIESHFRYAAHLWGGATHVWFVADLWSEDLGAEKWGGQLLQMVPSRVLLSILMGVLPWTVRGSNV